jgi:hypothetical protein
MLKSREKEVALVCRPPTLITEEVRLWPRDGMDRQAKPSQKNRDTNTLPKE